MDETRSLLRHFLAALAYRTQKALRGAPESFPFFQAAEGVRSPMELVQHMESVLGYARTFFIGGAYKPIPLQNFQAEVERFHKTIEELAALLRKEPGQHSYPSPGNGSLIHISSLLFCQRVQAEGMHVPYRGSAPATQDTLAGRHTFQIDALGSVKGFIDSGRLTVLAVCAEKRLPSLPNVPTVQERLGFPFNVSTWNMVFAPAGTPRPIVDKLNATINEAIKSPELIEKAKPLEIEFVQSTPASAKAFYEQQMAFWVPIVKASGAKVE